MELYDVEEDLLDKADPIPDISRVSLNSSNNVGISHVGHQQSSNQSHGKSNSVSQRLLKSYPNHSSAVSDDSPTFFDRTKSNRQSNKVSSVVSLNVGGVYFTTLRSTLLKYQNSMLAAMFSGRHEMQVDSRGASFIDRNGTYFGYILEFLRTETLPPNEYAVGVLMEARYYGLDELEDRMAVVPSISALIVKENHRSQFPDYQENKKRIIQIAMENATVSKTGEVLIYAFRTEFVPKSPNFNVNHHCSADQAHISIGPWKALLMKKLSSNALRVT
ncbi:hypothetical protein EB796_018242 [Bugula neritina]|uniref:BTB domain-containing protein n=1 Tax=Bugula neritina TaxID=10212 RepID=A0A7J7JB23_BUGNE|nr:hypothetical protein EB796_018242 [Bugula neritina]